MYVEITDVDVIRAVTTFWDVIDGVDSPLPKNVAHFYKFAYRNVFFHASIPVLVVKNVDVMLPLLEKANAFFEEHMRGFGLKRKIVLKFRLLFTLKIDWGKTFRTTQIQVVPQVDNVELHLRSRQRYAYSNKAFAVSQFINQRNKRSRSASTSESSGQQLLMSDKKIRSDSVSAESYASVCAVKDTAAAVKKDAVQEDETDVVDDDLNIGLLISEFRALHNI